MTISVTPSWKTSQSYKCQDINIFVTVKYAIYVGCQKIISFDTFFECQVDYFNKICQKSSESHTFYSWIFCHSWLLINM